MSTEDLKKSWQLGLTDKQNQLQQVQAPSIVMIFLSTF